MRKLLLPIVYLSMFFASSFANAVTSLSMYSFADKNEGVYISAFGGATLTSKVTTNIFMYAEQNTDILNYTHFHVDGVSKDKLKTDVPFGISMGYHFEYYSFDIQYTNISSKIKEAYTHSTILLNATQNGVSFIGTGFNSEVDNNPKGKYNVQFLLTNAYYNFNNMHDIVKPYIGIGGGIALISFKEQGESNIKTKNPLAYQFTVGSKFNVHENVQIFVDLRHTATANADVKNFPDQEIIANGISGNAKLKTHYYSVNIGAQYNI